MSDTDTNQLLHDARGLTEAIMEAAVERQRGALSSILQQLEATIQTKSERIVELEKDLMMAKVEGHDARRHLTTIHTQHNEQIAALTERLNQLHADEVRRLGSVHSDELKGLQERFAGLMKKVRDELEAERNRCDAEVLRVQQESSAAQNALLERAEADKRGLISAFEAERSALIEGHETERQSRVAVTEQVRSETAANFADRVATLEAELARVIEVARADRAALVQAHEQQVSSLTSELEATLIGGRDALAAAEARHQQELEANNAAHAERRRDLAVQIQKRFDDQEGLLRASQDDNAVLRQKLADSERSVARLNESMNRLIEVARNDLGALRQIGQMASMRQLNSGEPEDIPAMPLRSAKVIQLPLLSAAAQ